MSQSSLVLPPLSVYVHIPWCVKKCPYCDFNSHATSSTANNHSDQNIPEAEYIAQLLADLKADALYAQGRKIQSIFFGGGTPSLFSPSAIGRIIDAIDDVIGIDPSAEITLEANPGTTEQSRFLGYHSAGVNRLSIGAQSLKDEHLQTLGRIHGSQDIYRAVDSARAVGFDNFNVDLMHGLPNQSIDDALDDLNNLIALSPTHLSWYQLTIEKNTAFYRHPPKLPDDDTLASIEEAGFSVLNEAGFAQYEVSAFCQIDDHDKQTGTRSQTKTHSLASRHNLNYWQFGDYLGIGAGAHGKVTDLESNRILRRQKTRLPAHYLEADFDIHSNKKDSSSLIATNNVSPTAWTPIDETLLPLEFMMNGLRLTDGIAADLFSERTGLSNKVIEPSIHSLIEKTLLEDLRPLDVYKTTPLGKRFLNEVVATFMDDE